MLLVLAACVSIGERDTPEQVYQQYHSAIRAKNFAEYERLSAAVAREQLQHQNPEERRFMMEMFSQFVPPTYTIIQSSVDPSGNTALLRVGGTSTVGDKERVLEGLIKLVKEESGWKVDHPDSWTIKSERPVKRAN
jgi:hypothetical protein